MTKHCSRHCGYKASVINSLILKSCQYKEDERNKDKRIIALQCGKCNVEACTECYGNRDQIAISNVVIMGEDNFGKSNS